MHASKCLMLYFFRNSTGHVVSAESVRSVWRTTFDPKDKLTDATAEFGITGSDIYLADDDLSFDNSYATADGV